jgi:hypothetical protein
MTSAENLARRRQELITIIAVQRSSLQLQKQMWRTQLHNFALGWNMINRLRKNPLIIGGLLLTVIVIKPRRILSAVQQSRAIWQRIRILLPLISLFSQAGKVK